MLSDGLRCELGTIEEVDGDGCRRDKPIGLPNVVHTNITNSVVLPDSQGIGLGTQRANPASGEIANREVRSSGRSFAGAGNRRCPGAIDEACHKSSMDGSTWTTHLIGHIQLNDVTATVNEVTMRKRIEQRTPESLVRACNLRLFLRHR